MNPRRVPPYGMKADSSESLLTVAVPECAFCGERVLNLNNSQKCEAVPRRARVVSLISRLESDKEEEAAGRGADKTLVGRVIRALDKILDVIRV